MALRIPTEREYNIRSRFQGASTNILGKTLFAHTSPVYLSIAGREVCKPADAKQLIATLQASHEHIRTKGDFKSAEKKRAVLKIYEDAISKLYKRLQPGDANQ